MGGTDSTPRRQWRCRALGIEDYPVEYVINSLGYRTREFDSVCWQASTVVIGCSFVFGTGLRDRHTLSGVLSDRLGHPVINLGVQGASNDRIHRLCHQVLLLQPRSIVCAWSFAHRFDWYWEGVYHSVATEPQWMRGSVGSGYGELLSAYQLWHTREDHLEHSASLIADTPPGVVHTSIAEPKIAQLCSVDYEVPNRWDVCRDGWHPSAARVQRWAESLLPLLENV